MGGVAPPVGFTAQKVIDLGVTTKSSTEYRLRNSFKTNKYYDMYAANKYVSFISILICPPNIPESKAGHWKSW